MLTHSRGDVVWTVVKSLGAGLHSLGPTHLFFLGGAAAKLNRTKPWHNYPELPATLVTLGSEKIRSLL